MKEKQIIGNIIGGISALIGIYKFFTIYEAYQMFGSLLDNPWSQSKMNGQIGIAFVFCIIGAGLLIWANFRNMEDARKWYSNLPHFEGCGCRKCQEIRKVKPIEKSDEWVDPYGV